MPGRWSALKCCDQYQHIKSSLTNSMHYVESEKNLLTFIRCADDKTVMLYMYLNFFLNHREILVELHRPRCLAMYRWIKSQELVLDICSTGVASECKFRNTDTNYEPHPYKEYRDIYPKWKITPDLSISASSYWKWFVCKYSSEIAERYDAKETDIPESWKEITKEQVLTHIKKIDTSTS